MQIAGRDVALPRWLQTLRCTLFGHAASVPLYVGRHCVRCWQRTDDVGEPAPQVDTEEQLEILIAAGFSLAMIWKHFPGLRRFIHFDKD